MLADELPESATDYDALPRLRRRTPRWLTQMREYNQFWVDNVAYVDIPDKNVEKISYYRTWENRFNTFDGNIPGNDYQFPVDLEGALGYNNQISLTVPMRMQDLKFWRDPLYSYGPVAVAGRGVRLPGVPRQPGQHRRTGTTPTSSGPPRRPGRATWSTVARRRSSHNLAKYSECDVKGTLAKFDTNHNNLIEYTVRHAARQRRRLGGVRVLRHPAAGPHRELVLVLRRPGRRGRVHACSATPPRRPR